MCLNAIIKLMVKLIFVIHKNLKLTYTLEHVLHNHKSMNLTSNNAQKWI